MEVTYSTTANGYRIEAVTDADGKEYVHVIDAVTQERKTTPQLMQNSSKKCAKEIALEIIKGAKQP